MNEDLKIDIYQRVVNDVDYSEKEAVKKTVCVLYAKKFANGMRKFISTRQTSWAMEKTYSKWIII